MNVPDAVSASVVRMTDSVPSVRVSIALMHTVTTPSVSLTVYMTGSNPTRITAINHSEYYMHTNPLNSDLSATRPFNHSAIYLYMAKNLLVDLLNQ